MKIMEIKYIYIYIYIYIKEFEKKWNIYLGYLGDYHIYLKLGNAVKCDLV